MIIVDSELKAELDREAFKDLRAKAVERITVETASGRIFDGDEVSQNRMVRAITGLEDQPEGATVSWVLADNTRADVDLSEMREALRLAGLRQTELWMQGKP